MHPASVDLHSTVIAALPASTAGCEHGSSVRENII